MVQQSYQSGGRFIMKDQRDRQETMLSSEFLQKLEGATPEMVSASIVAQIVKKIKEQAKTT